MLTHDQKIALSVSWVKKIFKNKLTFCGSIGLEINGLLGREVGDIDVITDADWFGIDPMTYVKGFDWDKFDKESFYQGNSAKFYVKGVLVKCFKLLSPYGIKIDVMYRGDGTTSKMKSWKGMYLKVEEPVQCMRVKLEYLARWQEMEGCTGKSINKHRKDVDYYKRRKNIEYDYQIK